MATIPSPKRAQLDVDGKHHGRQREDSRAELQEEAVLGEPRSSWRGARNEGHCAETGHQGRGDDEAQAKHGVRTFTGLHNFQGDRRRRCRMGAAFRRRTQQQYRQLLTIDKDFDLQSAFVQPSPGTSDEGSARRASSLAISSPTSRSFSASSAALGARGLSGWSSSPTC